MSKRLIQIKSVNQYVTTINRYPLLTRERELELAALIHGSDPDKATKALDELVTSNLRLVVKIAHDFKQFDLGFEDLLAEGNLGLMTAAKRFEAGHGAKFSCYAAWWIKQAMRKALAEKTRIIKLPVEQAKKRVAVDKATSTLMLETGNVPTDSQISEICGLTPEQVNTVRHFSVCDASLDDVIGHDDEMTLSDVCSCDPWEDEEEQTKYSKLEHMVSTLADLDRYILTWTYGLDGHQLTESTIAQETGIDEPNLERKLDGLMVTLRERVEALD